MNDYKDLNRDAIREINMLAGTLGLPENDEYTDLAAFLHDVRSRIIESRYSLEQGIRHLSNKRK